MWKLLLNVAVLNRNVGSSNVKVGVSEHRALGTRVIPGKVNEIAIATKDNIVPHMTHEVYAIISRFACNKAVINTKLFDTLKFGRYEEIPLEEGQILKITPRGELSYSKFDYDEYAAYGLCRWYDYGWGFATPMQSQSSKDDYLSMLKQAALMEGYDSSEIDALVAEGFSPDEIEDYIYGCYSY